MTSQLNKWTIVIPARIGSTRLPEKPLQLLGEKPLVYRVWENLLPLEKLGANVVIATDSDKIQKSLANTLCQVIMTSPDHHSGTERCLEVAQNISRPFILNVQGDEPFIATKDLIKLTNAVENSQEDIMGTLVYRSQDKESFHDPHTVKVTLNNHQEALYFSRSPIPFFRNANEDFWFYQHMGTYAYSKQTLELLCSLPRGFLTRTESLEQLVALENAIKIKCLITKHLSIGIDTKKDLQLANQLFQGGNNR